MAYLTSENLSLHYTDDGAGEAIITLHGLTESGRYWTLPGISCPVLMLLGEHDVQFIKPAELVAREVPHCTHRVLAGRGHMLALENPQELGDELIASLNSLQE